jgi:aryl-alcohol dehydrogenase-like predicted oxidoreductase
VLASRATAAGTRRFAARFAAPGTFRTAGDRALSSLGVGTFPGDADGATDRRYADVVAAAVSLGCNVFDTAVAYRNQRSERVLGTVLDRLVASRWVRRDEIVLSSKAGFLPYDAASGLGVVEYAFETFIRTRIVSRESLVAGRHSLAPAFLRHQIDASRSNLRCATVDIFYLHNPDTQLREISRRELRRRLSAAFATLEEAAAEGKIGGYGVSSWAGFRAEPGTEEFLSLEELNRCAIAAGGPGHGFRAVMTPLSLAKPEAAVRRNQPGRGGGRATLLAAARELGLTVFAASVLDQGRLAREGDSATRRAIEYARSATGVTTAIIGTTDRRHLREALVPARVPALDDEKTEAVDAVS